MNPSQPLSRKEQRQLEREQKHLNQQKMLHSQKMKKRIIALVSVLVVVGAVVGLIFLQQQKLTIVNLTPDPGKGPKDAKVLVTEYGDFQCPACAANAPVVEDLITQYGDKIRFEFNDFPLPQHQYAVDSAIAAQCAFDQDKFFEIYDMLYAKQNEWASALTHASAQETIRSYVQGLGLDMTKFDACVVDPNISKRIDEDLNEGRKAGINSTPTFFVNGKRITDTPFSTNLKKAIDAALAQ